MFVFFLSPELNDDLRTDEIQTDSKLLQSSSVRTPNSTVSVRSRCKFTFFALKLFLFVLLFSIIFFVFLMYFCCINLFQRYFKEVIVGRHLFQDGDYPSVSVPTCVLSYLLFWSLSNVKLSNYFYYTVKGSQVLGDTNF
jgi:hypothetical protein